jgi:hypothetical protein
VEALAALYVMAVLELVVGEDVAVGMHDALRQAGRARGVVELRGILSGCVERLEVLALGREQGVVKHQHAGNRGAVEAFGVGGVGYEHLRLGVAEAVCDPLIAVEDRHREQDCAELPRREEDRGGLRRGRQHDRYTVAGPHAVAREQVRRTVGERLHIAPMQRAHDSIVALMHHRERVGMLTIADLGGDVVALRHRPAMLPAKPLVALLSAEAHRSVAVPVGPVLSGTVCVVSD